LASIAVLKHLGMQQVGTVRLPNDPEALLLFEKEI
jgi:RimJ/RimL family protein N-acetyltransferase